MRLVTCGRRYSVVLIVVCSKEKEMKVEKVKFVCSCEKSWLERLYVPCLQLWGFELDSLMAGNVTSL